MIEWREGGTGTVMARVRPGDPSPCVALAVHAGHLVSEDLGCRFALSEDDRLREEDPFTASFVPESLTLVEARHSRFEVDLNRPREKCVYLRPKDAWGLEVWREPLPVELRERARALYDDFYAELEAMLGGLVEAHGRAIVLDLHSYNHRRPTPESAPASPLTDPEVNLGTARIGDAGRWRPVIDTFLDSMEELGFQVGENTRFGGGHLSEWINGTFPDACPLAIEFKKTFMDEWTGEPNPAAILRIREAMTVVIPRLEMALREVGPA